MLTLTNKQATLFDSVYEPIYQRANNPDLDKIQQVLETHHLMAAFSRSLLEHEKAVAHWGRPTHPVEVIAKLLILRRCYKSSFRAAEEMANDSNSVRKFLGLRDEAAPHYSILSRWNRRIPESLWKTFNQLLTHVAKQEQLTTGRKMRMDTTVVEADIHHPTDSSLLHDGIKKLGRLAQKAKRLGVGSGQVVRNFSRSAKKRLMSIVKYARKRTEENIALLKENYQELVTIAKRAVTNGKRLQEKVATITETGKNQIHKPIKRLQTELEVFLPRIEQVIEQTIRRVFRDESVAVADKLVSIYQPHAYPVCKGKAAKAVQFGQVVKIQEADGGIITDWEVYQSQPSDSQLFIQAIEKHKEIFNKAPILACGDRGVWSAENETQAEARRVKRVCIPKRGKKSKERVQMEKERWFRAGMRFRTGSEGTISVLKRGNGMGYCRDKGQETMNNWVGLSCVARNLWRIAHAIA